MNLEICEKDYSDYMKYDLKDKSFGHNGGAGAGSWHFDVDEPYLDFSKPPAGYEMADGS